MVKKTIILKELNKLNVLYNNSKASTDIDLPKYYSKLALLELCGWIEESIDNLINEYADRKINETTYIENVLDHNYSFDYKRFKKMMITLVGLAGFEKIENKINIVNRARLESSLNSLKSMRDDHAHTTLIGIGSTRTLYTPSVIIPHLNDIYYGLREYEKRLKSLKYRHGY
jgi:hypothetical protein